jgi:hypothetical protein
MTLKDITSDTVAEAMRLLTAEQLRDLAKWCDSRATDLEWEKHCKEVTERDAQWKREREEAEAAEKALVAKLSAVIKPGTRLKMKGCKDRLGLREFIRWDGSNLVCWQIRRQLIYSRDFKTQKVEEFNTNQVTTHMPDKVQEIYVDGTALKVKSILK